MNKVMEQNDKTRNLLIKHCQKYPKLKTEDIFKYVFQSSFGCEHLVTNEFAALDYIKREYGELSKAECAFTEPLDGEYSRVYLSCINEGINTETLAKIFCLSAKKEPNGKALLEQKLQVAKELVMNGELPLDINDFNEKLRKWRAMGYPAIHHSEDFRSEYHPAYRVIANRYVEFMPLFKKIDKLSGKEAFVIAIDGGSASGKTALAEILKEVYDCNVIHMDDFFLRPEQRTRARFDEVGGNIDRERFYEEVVCSLNKNEPISYRRFDCSTQVLGGEVTLPLKKLTVVEGAYSMHPAFGKYYDISVFLDIKLEFQKERILKRNTSQLANRFFNEWIPLENRYFSGVDIKNRADLVLSILPAAD